MAMQARTLFQSDAVLWRLERPAQTGKLDQTARIDSHCYFWILTKR